MQDRCVGSVLFVGLQSSCLGLGRRQLRAERLGVVRLRIYGYKERFTGQSKLSEKFF